jgi:choloylglycine hydrolase
MLMGSVTITGGCTVFTASVGDTVLFGNNEDVGDKDATVWFVPATETTYGWVYFGFHDYPIRNDHFPMGGMNDQGLCFDITSIPPTVRPLPETIEEALQFIEQYNLSFPGTFNGGVFGEQILETCATVEEAVQVIEQYDLLFYGEYQFLFADRTGDSMVLCPNPQGAMEIIRKEGVYQVITNFNIVNPGLGQYPCQRYDSAVWMLQEIESEDDLTVEYVTSILESTHSQGTTYSTIYDPVQGKVYLYNHHRFGRVVVFDIEDELEKGYHFYEVVSLLRERGESPLTQAEDVEEPRASPRNLCCAIFASVLILIVIVLLQKRRKNRGR